METRACQGCLREDTKFLSYLWGMETLESLYQPIFRALVLILPMRNGNYSLQKYRCKNLYSCSYPTYEEWKHEVIIGDSDEMYVLILPMRNGNWVSTACWARLSRFLSYLWGMETISKKCCKFKTVFFVLILPMRNGNSSIAAILESEECSYPTYEEWKLLLLPLIITPFLLFLSYLWGMETWTGFYIQQRKRMVLILPMRNGNSKFPAIFSVLYKFLSYLWGMET